MLKQLVGRREEMADHHAFTMYVNNQPVLTEEHQLLGDAIKSLAGIPLDYSLYIIQGAETETIGDDQVVHIHEGIRFRAIPAATMGCVQCLLLV